MFFEEGGVRLIFSGNTGAPSSAAPVFLEKFSPTGALEGPRFPRGAAGTPRARQGQ